jgi:hypothetical protein
MEENKAKTTETANLAASNGTDAGTVASEATDGNAVAMMASCTDSAVDEKSRETGDATSLIGETVDVNRENARRRREAERERALKEARERAIIETLEGKNPYDGSEMKDAADVERFLEMKKEYLKREEEEACAEEKRERWFSEDRADFCRAYPDVELDRLIEDERFCRFAEGKVGNLPMREIYEGFREFISAFDERAKSLAAQALANGAAGPGALGGAKRAAGDSYTAEEVRRMSPREVRENYEKIRNSMTKW